MLRKFTAALAAFALVFTAFAPSVASARDRHGGYHGGGGYYGGGGYGGSYYRHRDHHGDALAAGVVGLVLGLAVGAAASEPRGPRYSCYNGCYAAPPPPPCGRCYAPGNYGQQGYYRQGYAPQPYYQQRYDDGSAYDPRYADDRDLDGGYYDRGGCTRSERQWDRYARRYVMVEVPC